MCNLRSDARRWAELVRPIAIFDGKLPDTTVLTPAEAAPRHLHSGMVFVKRLAIQRALGPEEPAP